MFVCSCVEDDLRSVLCQYLLHTSLVLDVTDDVNDLLIGVGLGEFLFNLISGKFVHFKEHEKVGLEANYLPTEFRSDRASSPSHHDYLAHQEFVQTSGVQNHGLAAK